MDISSVQKKQLEILKQRIPYEEYKFGDKAKYTSILLNLLEDAKYIALSYLFPFEDFSKYELPSKWLNWQIRASVELYRVNGYAGITSYMENGLSWTRLTDGLSSSLMNELIAKAGIPKKKKDYVEIIPVPDGEE